MPTRETYLLHLHRSRAAGGWQWAARLEHLPGDESVRFTDPEALLAHLRTVLWSGDPADQAPETPETPESVLPRIPDSQS